MSIAGDEVCRAIVHAHSSGVIHTDLKPGNVLIGQRGEVMVMDWGLVKYMRRGQQKGRDETSIELDTLSDDASDSLRTLPGDVIGTPAYMSPEQARGEVENVGPATDVYALGTVLYECVAGVNPFSAPTTSGASLAPVDSR